jgi:hypothetical protein
MHLYSHKPLQVTIEILLKVALNTINSLTSYNRNIAESGVKHHKLTHKLLVREFMVFNATFNNISIVTCA